MQFSVPRFRIAETSVGGDLLITTQLYFPAVSESMSFDSDVSTRAHSVTASVLRESCERKWKHVASC